jgi:hypothetical protein
VKILEREKFRIHFHLRGKYVQLASIVAAYRDQKILLFMKSSWIGILHLRRCAGESGGWK